MPSLSSASRFYASGRPEVARLVPASARRILDVGCAQGALGGLLKEADPGREVFGIEQNTESAAVARQVLDQVFEGDVQQMEAPLPAGSLDCLIFADVLEHLVDPLAVLRRFVPMVAPTGAVLCSIPNMRHYSVIHRLLTRGWHYDDQGLFDRTHLRFFSRSSMKPFLEGAGLRDLEWTPSISCGPKMRRLHWLLGARIDEFVALQYLVKGRPPEAPLPAQLGRWP